MIANRRVCHNRDGSRLRRPCQATVNNALTATSDLASDHFKLDSQLMRNENEVENQILSRTDTKAQLHYWQKFERSG